MIRALCTRLLPLAICLAFTALVGAYPKPSPYPVTWELKFEYDHPKRLVITPPGAKEPQAFWYVTYTITNPTRDEQKFMPVFEMMTEDGRIVRGDKDIPTDVLTTIRIREKKPHLLSALDIAGNLRPGDDQAKDGVAIWREPMVRMGQFTIFVAGISGEAVVLEPKAPRKDKTILWKTLQIRYHMLGDDRHPGIQSVEFVDESWVMR